MKAFTQQELRKRMTVSMQMSSVVSATQCLKQLVVFIDTVHVKAHNLLQLKRTLNVEHRREKRMKCRDSKSRRKFTLLSKCGFVNGGNCTRLMCQKFNTGRKHSHTSVHCVRTRYETGYNHTHCLVKCSVISNFQNVWEKNLPFFCLFLKIQTYVEKILAQ